MSLSKLNERLTNLISRKAPQEVEEILLSQLQENKLLLERINDAVCTHRSIGRDFRANIPSSDRLFSLEYMEEEVLEDITKIRLALMELRGE